MVTFTRGELATRLRPNETASQYNPARTVPANWTNPNSLDIPNVAIAPSSTFLSADPTRSLITTEMSAFMAYGSDVLPGDRLVVAGVTWQVEAERQDWRNPYDASTPGLEVRVTKYSG